MLCFYFCVILTGSCYGGEETGAIIYSVSQMMLVFNGSQAMVNYGDLEKLRPRDVCALIDVLEMPSLIRYSLSCRSP